MLLLVALVSGDLGGPCGAVLETSHVVWRRLCNAVIATSRRRAGISLCGHEVPPVTLWAAPYDACTTPTRTFVCSIVGARIIVFSLISLPAASTSRRCGYGRAGVRVACIPTTPCRLRVVGVFMCTCVMCRKAERARAAARRVPRHRWQLP